MPLSIRELFQSTLKLSSSRKNPSSSPDIRLDNIIPFAGLNTCLFQVSMRGVTQEGVRHRVNILVNNIKVERTKTEGYFKFTDKDGDFWVEKPNPNTGSFRVRCSCHDHYFTWGWWNFIHDACFGVRPRPYKRKTPPPPKGYPYRNPLKIVGICRHIVNSVRLLQAKNLFK